jgi:hypothetical protein
LHAGTETDAISAHDASGIGANRREEKRNLRPYVNVSFNSAHGLSMSQSSYKSFVRPPIELKLNMTPTFPRPTLAWYRWNFQDSHICIENLRIRGETIVYFLRWNGTRIRLLLDGNENNGADMTHIVIEITHSDGPKEFVLAVVMGTVMGTSTVVLMDEDGRIWFYNDPDISGPSFEGMPGRLALVRMPEYGMEAFTELQFVRFHNEVAVVHTEHCECDSEEEP